MLSLKWFVYLFCQFLNGMASVLLFAHTCLHCSRNGLQGESSWILRSYWLRTVTSLEYLYHSPYPRSALQSCPGSFKPLYVIFPYVLPLRLSWQISNDGCSQSMIQPVDLLSRNVLSSFMSGSPWLVVWRLQILRDSALFFYLHIRSFTRRKFQILFFGMNGQLERYQYG